MFKKTTLNAITTGLAVLLFSQAALAEDATIEFTGEIINSSCTVSTVANSSGTSGTVDFGTLYTAQSFPSVDTSDTSIAQNFTIELTDCTVGVVPTITLENGTTTSDSTDSELFVTSLTGYGIKIVDSNNTSTVYTSGAATKNSGLTDSLTDGTTTSATLPFTAYLVRYLEDSSSGSFSNTVTFTINYSDS